MKTIIRQTPDAATGTIEAGSNVILDKRQFAKRWQFSTRKIDHLIASGLPHLKIGARRVRIFANEGDAWMREQFFTQRRGGAR